MYFSRTVYNRDIERNKKANKNGETRVNFLETLKENNLSFKPNLSSFAAKTNKKELEAVSDELTKIHFEKKTLKRKPKLGR